VKTSDVVYIVGLFIIVIGLLIAYFASKLITYGGLGALKIWYDASVIGSFTMGAGIGLFASSAIIKHLEKKYSAIIKYLEEKCQESSR